MSKKQKKQKSQLNSYIKYSAFAIQITVIIFIAYYLGDLLDITMRQEKKTFTIIFSLVSIFGSLCWFFYKIKNDEKG